MKPILFNTEMVRAILEDRKTVTRRVVKDKDITNWWDCEADGTPIAFIEQATGDHYPPTYPCPYQPGDILYVREPFWQSPNGEYTYKSDSNRAERLTWHPSIHMPKEAARIFLRVTDVRVERLQDIDNAGALAEGCDGRCEGPQDGGLSDFQKSYDFIVERFQGVWDSTVKPADRALYGWEANPWVWVIEFERCEKPEGD